MRTYADPTHCPDCGAVRVTGSRCGTCGLLLQGALADRLWGLLTATDQTLAQMRVERDAAVQPTVASPQPPPAPQAPPSVPLPPESDAAAARPPRRPVSVAAVLLGLGALLVVVAAFVFLAVTWGRLSLEARALVLAAMTALAATVATLISRRELRASAEAAWAVTLAMLALDVAAARTTGLLGLDRPPETAYLVGTGLLLTLAGSGVAAAFRGRLGLALVVPQLVSLWGLVLAGTAGLADWDARLAWRLLVAAGLAALVAVGHRVLRLSVVAVVAGVTAAVAGLAQAVIAWAGVVDAGTWRAAWLEGAAWPSVASVLVLLLLGRAAPRLLATIDVPLPPEAPTGPDPATTTTTTTGHTVDLPALLVSLASFAAAGIALTWVLVPLTSNASGERIAVVLAVAALTLAVVCIPVAGAWGRGLRALAALVGVGSLLGCLDEAATGAVTLVAAVSPVWQQPLGVALRVVGGPVPNWWTASLQLAVAGLSVLVAAYGWRWRHGTTPAWLRRLGLPLAVVLGTGAAALPLTVLRTPVVVVCAIAVAAGAGLAAWVLGGRPRVGLALAAGAALAFASYEALASATLSALTWGAVAALLVAATVRLARLDAARFGATAGVTAALAGGYAVGVLLATSDALDWSLRTTSLVLVAAAAALAAGAQGLRRRASIRRGTELSSLLPALLAVAGGVLVAFDDGPAFLALVLTLLGAATAAVAVLMSDRRRLAPVAGGLLAVAWWLRLAASDVSTIEAYTLPVAALLLLAGLWAMLRRPGTHSLTALLPGLLLATTPSLPAALAEPSSVRGLLFGLAALVLVGVGARLAWVAPFAVGVVEAALLAVRHLTPFADALPRWVLLAAAGLLLLGAGTTWESRARQARRGLAAVRAMR
jgi:hypothetical protein